jgi:cell shape-determining protein MreC
MSMYEKYNELRDKDLTLKSLENENNFYKSENQRLKKLLDEKCYLRKITFCQKFY